MVWRTTISFCCSFVTLSECEHAGSIKKDGTGEECKGKVRNLNSAIARKVGGTTDAWACTLHRTRIFNFVHSKELHHKNIPEKLYKTFDRIRQTVSGYRIGVIWCTYSRKSRKHLFKSEADYNRP